MGVVIYGLGKRAKIIIYAAELLDIGITGIFDSAPQKWGQLYCGYTVKTIHELANYRKSQWIVGVLNDLNYEKISKMLIDQYDFEVKNEITYVQIIQKLCYKIYNTKIKHYSKRENNDRVVFECANGLCLGGVEAWTVSIVGKLLQEGIYARILSDTSKYNVPKIVENNIDKVIQDSEECYVSNMEQIFEYLYGKEKKILVTKSADMFLIAGVILKKYENDNIRIIAVVHSNTKRTLRDYSMLENYIDYYVAVSEDIAKGLRTYGVGEEKTSIVTLPFVCEEKLERIYSTNKNQPIRIGYAGRVGFGQKRMDLLPKLLDELEKRNILYHMEIAGTGTAVSFLEKYIGERKMEEHVKLLGSLERTKIPDFWKKQDIAINLSDFEGHSISQMEAMANGAVPVLTDVSGVRDDVIYGVNGYYVPAGDYMGLADRIEYLYCHREKLPIMGQAAHDEVYPKSSMEKHVEFWKEKLKLW